MDRPKRNAIEKRDSNVPTKFSVESNKSTQLCKKKNGKNKVKHIDESSFQSKDCVQELVVVLEDICKPSRVKERKVFGDKTNGSLVLTQNKTLNCQPNSKYFHTISPLSHKKFTDKSRLLVDRMELSSKMPASDIADNHSDLPKKCVYAKLQRESLKNRTVPFEEKMAEYEFEVDENEPVVKVKKKKNVKRKRKILSPDQEYVPKGKIKIGETVKHKEVLCEQNLKSKPAISEVENCEVNLKNKNIITEISRTCSSQSVTNRSKVIVENNSQVERSKRWNTPQRSVLKHLEEGDKKSPSSAASLCRYRTVRKLSDSLQENVSPVVRAKYCRTPQMLIRDLDDDFSEMEVSTSENRCEINLRVVKETPQPCQELNPIENPNTSMEIHAIENGTHDKSMKLSSPVGIQKGTTIVTADTAKPLVSTSSQQGLHRTESTSLHNDKTANDIQSSFDRSVSHYTYIPLPRVSGVHHQFCEESEGKWNLDNCFGFEDDIEETEMVIPMPEISLKKRLRRLSPISSTPLITNKKSSKIERLSTFFRKHELTTKTVSPKSAQVEGKFTDSHKMEPLPSTSVVHSPFSNPLKQTKLNFTSNTSSNFESPQQNDEESPLLFKSAEDKTPVHFKEPPRRSYIRTVRRKMKPIGHEWIEIDSDSDEELICKQSVKRTKKVKQNKQEVKDANKWIKSFNDQCEEIEDFELCVE